MTPFRQIRLSKAEALLALSLIASTIPLAAVAGKPEPFSAGVQFSEVSGPSTDPTCQPTPTAPGGTAMGVIDGSGLATEIGAFTFSAVDCVRSADPYGFTPPFALNSLSAVLTTASGDRIVLSFNATAQLTSAGVFALTGQFTFVSGTGKFKKIKGSGTLTGVEDGSSSPARGFIVLTGTISD